MAISESGSGAGRLERFAEAIVRVVPDAITNSVLLLVILVAAALALGNPVARVVDAYYRGFWSLLAFTGQMTFIIVLGGALSATPFFRRMIGRLACVPRTREQAIALSAFCTACCAYCFWGLGYSVGPLMAVYFAREAERKGIALHFPFFMATNYAATAVWQFGLSASAPLIVATPGHFLEKMTGVIPLERTIWSPAALLDLGLYMIGLVAVGCWMMPKAHRPLSEYPGALALTEPLEEAAEAPKTLSERLEQHTLVVMTLALAVSVWLWEHFVNRAAGLNINSLNMILLWLVLVLYGRVWTISRALQKAVVSAWPIIILYHLYAGLAGLIEFTTVGERAAALAASASNAWTFPALTASVSTLFAFFIPSSGGQWAIQGLVTVKAAMATGVPAERALLALSVGDHMGNLISPFWYVIVAGVARLNFRAFFGYGLLYAALWFVIGVVVMTMAPVGGR